METPERHAPKKFDLEVRTSIFAKRVREFTKKLPRSWGNREDIPQLIRSSGSVAANYIEANEGLGKNDFPMRIKICLKESKESALWLELCDMAGVQHLTDEHQYLLSEAKQFTRIFSTILKNFQRNAQALKFAA